MNCHRLGERLVQQTTEMTNVFVSGPSDSAESLHLLIHLSLRTPTPGRRALAPCDKVDFLQRGLPPRLKIDPAQRPCSRQRMSDILFIGAVVKLSLNRKLVNDR